MGHDIYGINKKGEQIAYARFSMGNVNAFILYDLLNADEYNGGVSGIGGRCTFSLQELEKALHEFEQTFGTVATEEYDDWDIRQIKEFIQNCLEVAKKQKSIDVVFM
ncbi:hypothetical protein [Gracilibacillus massiliensis]|uniref:hypothetical protein n=1 Tax=Gracilibacillus massiliensis TaxID=1564956 RepID=UPI00071E430B|nr:hypothetical protein [Gracilibacillus massiliensis]